MKTLKKFEFKSRGFQSQYDWDKMLDGGIYELEAGKDFDCKESNFRTSLRTKAAKMGKGVRVQSVENGLVIQAYEMTESELLAKETRKAERAARKAGQAEQGEGEE